MLTDSFIASTRDPLTGSSTNPPGIHLHEIQPLPGLKHTFKNSSTNQKCLAADHPSHIFAAQSDKAAVHIYSKERGNRESVIPFPEMISSIALAGASSGAGILILGTESGRLILYEVDYSHSIMRICG